MNGIVALPFGARAACRSTQCVQMSILMLQALEYGHMVSSMLITGFGCDLKLLDLLAFHLKA